MAEQKSVGRTLDYSLKGDTLNRLKGATKATANVELQKLKGATGMLDTITVGAYAIGESVDRGREKTKELNKMWDDAISRGEWATPEAMENFKAMVNTDKEAYIEAVRTGNKEEQERLLSELNDNTTQLQATKDSITGLSEDYQEFGFKTNTESFPLSNQGAAATLAKNTDVTYVKEDGAMLSVIDATQDISDELGAMKKGAGESDDAFEARQKAFLEELITGEHIGTYEFADAEGNVLDPTIVSAGGFLELAKKMNEGKLQIKRKFNSAQVDELSKQARKPVELIKDVSGMLDEMQAGASDPKNPTYFDYGSTNNMVKNAIQPEDISSYLFEDIGAGSTFAEDYKYNPNLNIPVMVGFEKYDDNGDGVLSKEEQTGGPTNQVPITLDDDQKKLLIKEMAKPENSEIAREAIGEWLTFKAYGNWKLGLGQRMVTTETTDQSGATTSTSELFDMTTLQETDMDKTVYGNVYVAGSGLLGAETIATGGMDENNPVFGDRTPTTR